MYANGNHLQSNLESNVMPFTFCAKVDKEEEEEGISAGPTRQTYELQIYGVEYITITAFWIITVLVVVTTDNCCDIIVVEEVKLTFDLLYISLLLLLQNSSTFSNII